jgi:hypothetical protein
VVEARRGLEARTADRDRVAAGDPQVFEQAQGEVRAVDGDDRRVLGPDVVGVDLGVDLDDGRMDEAVGRVVVERRVDRVCSGTFVDRAPDLGPADLHVA